MNRAHPGSRALAVGNQRRQAAGIQPGAQVAVEHGVLVEGLLQIQEGVTSVKAERVLPLIGNGPEPESHDFR